MPFKFLEVEILGFNYLEKVMICPNCGKNNSDDVRECSCGAEFQLDQTLEVTQIISKEQIAEQIESDLDYGNEDQNVNGDLEVTAPMSENQNLTGQIIGKCRLESFLGRGGMGLVYKGRHTSLDVPVAIKIMLPQYSVKPEFVKRFYREAQVAAKINHQNVVRVYDCGSERDLLYIIMELVDNGDVSHILQRVNMVELDMSLDIALAVCSALIEAEKYNIIHRDIKPENIMVASDGTYKLADLGLAKQIDTIPNKDITLTMNNVCMGSPLYMPPEQASDARSCDSRADIYSLGCTLFHLLAGRPPYDGDTWQEIVCSHGTSQIPRASVYNKSVPPLLDQIIARCMAKKPKDRYDSARELYNELSSVRSGGTSSVDNAANKSYTRVGVSGAESSTITPPQSTVMRTAYKSERGIRSTLVGTCRDTAVYLECSSCRKVTPQSSLKYCCSQDGCENLICMDCWMRQGIRNCSKHSS